MKSTGERSNSDNARSNRPCVALAVDRHVTLDEVMLRGFDWFQSCLLATAVTLSRSPARGTKVASILELTGDVFFVIDCPEEAVKWYRRAVRKTRFSRELRREIQESNELIALQRSASGPAMIVPSGNLKTELVADDSRAYLRTCKSIALSQPLQNGIADKSQPWARLLSSRSLSTQGDTAAAFREFYSAVAEAEELSLNPADWFFLPASCWEYVSLWRALYDRRRSIRSLGLTNFDRQSVRSGPPELSGLLETNSEMWHRQVYPLLLRFHLYRSSSDRAGLQRLATRFPRWSDVLLTLKFFDRHGRCPLKDELLSLANESYQRDVR